MTSGRFAFHCTWVYLAICALIGAFFGLFGGVFGAATGEAGVAAIAFIAFFGTVFLGMLLNFLPIYLIVLVVGCVLLAVANKNKAS